jgi:hypothetical protein
LGGVSHAILHWLALLIIGQYCHSDPIEQLNMFS